MINTIFTDNEREELISKLINKWVDGIDMQCLIDYFVDGQELFLSSLPDNELLEYCEEEDIEVGDDND
ncbi:hypothetical protein UFOVP1655_129 [uncultured Caudovirales phage]|jgi:hypothetical protein|uniref:Uncharacterized protein n=1 Tax=uncultured Caudovirales phage TaxID=2100421 RepID=A0A6J5T6N1_9CAUD|nr:hypothetical protein UFOVP1655_129 [uncultured Caudovirales phage]